MEDGRKFTELSHTIEQGMVTYKGLPAPVISDYITREASKPHYPEGTSFQIGKIEMVANTGTYVDSPSIAMPTVRIYRSCRYTLWPIFQGCCSTRRQMRLRSLTIFLARMI